MQELVSPVIVICGIQAYVPDVYVRRIFAEFVDGGKEVRGIVPPCACKAEGKRQVHLCIRAVADKRVKGIAEK